MCHLRDLQDLLQRADDPLQMIVGHVQVFLSRLQRRVAKQGLDRGQVGPALGLLLDSVRWFTFQVGNLYLQTFERIFDEVRAGAPAVDFLLFHVMAGEHFPFLQNLSNPTLFKPSIARDLIDELQSRWSRLIAAAMSALIRSMCVGSGK